MPRTPARRAWGVGGLMLVVGAPMALLVLALAAAALLAEAKTSTRVSGSAVFAVLMTAALMGFVAVTRRRFPRAGVTAACYALAAAPLLGLVAASAIRGPILASTSALRGPTPRIPVAVSSDLMSSLLRSSEVLTSWPSVVVALALCVLMWRFDGAIRAVAVAAVGSALVLFGIATTRIGRPDPDTYVSSLVPLGPLTPAENVFMGLRLHTKIVDAEDADEASPGHESWRNFKPGECALVGLAGCPSRLYGGVGERCLPARVTQDPGGDLAFIEQRFGDSGDETWSAVLAFRPAEGTVVRVFPADVADRIAPPLGWTVGAGIGSVLGAILLLVAHRVRARARREGIDAFHLGGGWVELENGERLRVEGAMLLPRGDSAP